MRSLFFFVLLFMHPALKAEALANRGDALNQDLKRILIEERLAGAVYSTVVAGETRTGAAGYFDASTKALLRPDSKVHVGSITKTVLAVSLLHLVTEGRVSLDASVESVLPAIKFNNRWSATSPVRVRHLLDQTAGLEDLRLWHIFSAKTTPDTALVDVFTRDASVLRIRTEPGTQYSYSNLGYTLVGMVIEAVVNERYETWADREVVRKLGMQDSSFSFLTQRVDAADPRLAWGHLGDLSTMPAIPVAVRPAAQFTTTASDMALLARFLMSDGSLGGLPFVHAALLRSMGHPTTTHAARAGLTVGDGLGLTTRDRYGAVGSCRGGSTVGYRAMFCIFPEQQRAFFIAHNADSETAQYARTEARLVQELGVDTKNTLPRLAGLPSEWTGRYIPSPSRFEIASLADVLGSSTYLEAGPQTAALTPAWGESQLMFVVGDKLLQRGDRSRASHVLLSDTQGNRYITDHNGTMRRVSSIWHASIWFSVLLGLAGLGYWLIVIPARRIKHGVRMLQPASVAILLLLLPVPMFALQPFIELGDLTLGSGTLYVAFVSLPVLIVGQLGWVYHQRTVAASWRADLLATVLVLQFCALLFAWDLLPIALWR